MPKSTCTQLLSLLLVLLCSCLTAGAQRICVDGIHYGLIGTRLAYVVCPDLTPGAPAAYKGEVTIPATISYGNRTYTVFTVGESAFAGCDELTAVHLPTTVSAISACAFIGCQQLQEVSHPQGLQAIGSSAFVGCTSLRQLPLARKAEVIDTLTYNCCAAMPAAVISRNVRHIRCGAFVHCNALRHLYCFTEALPEVDADAFSANIMAQATLHVPSAIIASCAAHPILSRFAKIEPLTDADYQACGYRKGDINDDGLIDSQDLQLLRRLIVSLPVSVAHLWSADLNADGKVNAQDFVLLLQQL